MNSSQNGPRLIEVVVNVPIRRTFARQHSAPPPPDFETQTDSPHPAADLNAQDERPYRTFHYHLPIELEKTVEPGHLVWVPFGRQRLQGIVLNHAESAPTPTKAIIRLARPQPVLSPMQLELARWLANYYVAPLSETIRLFLPPRLLQKDEESLTVQARREFQVTWLGAHTPVADQVAVHLRATGRARLLAWFLNQGIASTPRVDELLAACGIKTRGPLQALVEQDVLAIDEDSAVTVDARQVRCLLAAEELRARYHAELGVARYLPLAQELALSPEPIWQSELYRRVDTDLATLRRFAGWGLIRLDERIRFRDPLAGRTYAQTYPPRLTPEQEAVWARLAEAGFGEESGQARAPGQSPARRFLLHGVTGSGKTEIYLRALAATLEQGRQAIVLVPEIALTPQTIARFSGRFPGRVTVIHSGLAVGERYDVWRAVRQGEFDIVVGPRSALFAPLPRLGLIIVDEEHEPSYKQDADQWGGANVFFDARTVATQMAELTGSVLVMGSATPSLEAYAAVRRGEVTLLEMPRRVMGTHDHAPGADSLAQGVVGGVVDGVVDGVAEARADDPANNLAGVEPRFIDLPPVEVVDMRQELRAGNRSILSRALQGELQATLEAGEQAILFLNRRGSSTFVMCRNCGHVENCSRCDAPLTFHENARVLICHHCNRRYPIPTQCPECESNRIKFFGAGTQRVEEIVHEIVPQARIVRWDADTAGRWDSHAALLERFAQHEADILIGTQMIAKGLDLPLVTLVGVVSADVGLYLPDFRSGERAFQLLTQVAGRAGRSRRPGRVVVQTYTPEHYVIQAAARHDYAAFVAREMRYRHEYAYPPVRRMARLVYWDRKREKAEEMAQAMGEQLRQRLDTLGLDSRDSLLIGPAPAFFARVRGQYRWQILLSAPDPGAVLRGMEFPFGWRVDVDPVSIL